LHFSIVLSAYFKQASACQAMTINKIETLLLLRIIRPRSLSISYMALSIQSYGANFHLLPHNQADFMHQISGTQIAFPHKTRFMKQKYSPQSGSIQFIFDTFHFRGLHLGQDSAVSRVK
jgi:hypothetical protein